MKRGFDLANLELQQVALRTRLYSFQSRFDTRLFFFQPLIECDVRIDASWRSPCPYLRGRERNCLSVTDY